MKRVAILQSNYIPWKGYFDLINSVDEFILYDDMQYTKRDWRNRNKIVTPNGLNWLTIPVETKGKYYQKINETIVSSNDWADIHWKTIQMNYAHAEFFLQYCDLIKDIYICASKEHNLSAINRLFLEKICEVLNIKTMITCSSDYKLIDGKTERLVDLVKQAGGNYYLSGPAAMDYIDVSLFEKNNIVLEYMDYSHYKPYKQVYGEFEHGVSIIDTLFNTGSECEKYVKCFKSKY